MMSEQDIRKKIQAYEIGIDVEELKLDLLNVGSEQERAELQAEISELEQERQNILSNISESKKIPFMDMLLKEDCDCDSDKEILQDEDDIDEQEEEDCDELVEEINMLMDLILTDSPQYISDGVYSKFKHIDDWNVLSIHELKLAKDYLHNKWQEK